MPRKPTTPARSCPKCDRLHLKINSYSTAGNAQWLCRADRKAPDGNPGCGYAETPDRVTPLTKAERSRNERQRRKARKALGKGDAK